MQPVAQSVAQNVLQPVARALAPHPSPMQPSTSIASTQPITTATSGSLLSDTGAKINLASTKLDYDSRTFATTASSPFGGILPQNWETFSRSFLARPDITPSLISLAVFFAVIAAILNVLYISDRRGDFTSNGHGRLAKLSQRFDITQLSVATIAIVGAGVVVAILLLARP